MLFRSSCMDYSGLTKAGVNVSLGTDGCSSNNNLDMFEEMKFASLLQKHHTGKPKILTTKETFDMGTINGAKALKLNAGEIKIGKLADVLLIDLKRPEMSPGHNLISDLVYSANGNCVDTTICNGEILMQNRKIDGEEKILEDVRETVQNLLDR